MLNDVVWYWGNPTGERPSSEVCKCVQLNEDEMVTNHLFRLEQGEEGLGCSDWIWGWSFVFCLIITLKTLTFSILAQYLVPSGAQWLYNKCRESCGTLEISIDIEWKWDRDCQSLRAPVMRFENWNRKRNAKPIAAICLSDTVSGTCPTLTCENGVGWQPPPFQCCHTCSWCWPSDYEQTLHFCVLYLSPVVFCLLPCPSLKLRGLFVFLNSELEVRKKGPSPSSQHHQWQCWITLCFVLQNPLWLGRRKASHFYIM